MQRSLASHSSTITYDLEDSVHPSSKDSARTALKTFLAENKAALRNRSLGGIPVAVRPNSPYTAKDDYTTLSKVTEEDTNGQEDVLQMDSWGYQDIQSIWGEDGPESLASKNGPMMLLPKVHHRDMLSAIDDLVYKSGRSEGRKIPLVASIESPQALMNLGQIAAWQGKALELVGIMFASEDFCASSGIIRTSSRLELLHARSSIVVAAQAYGLSAIDMVCIDYKNPDVLRAEAEEGRQLGFKAKQAIHPSQVDAIIEAFAPSKKDIERAHKILDTMAASSRGAEGLVGDNGQTEMIDKPMILQARRTIRDAKTVGRHPLGTSRSYSTSTLSRPSKACPKCGQLQPIEVTPCSNCRTPIPFPPDLLYHALFGLVPESLLEKPPKEILAGLPGGGFDIVPRDVRLRFLKCQQGIHPDSFAGAGEKEHSLAITQSSHLNKAYSTLADPLSRAKYLLEIHDYNISESDSLTDPELLMEIMEAREELEEATTQEDSERVRESTRAKANAVVDSLLEAFGSSPVDLERAKALTIELQYLQNLDNAAKEWQPGKRVELTH